MEGEENIIIFFRLSAVNCHGVQNPEMMYFQFVLIIKFSLTFLSCFICNVLLLVYLETYNGAFHTAINRNFSHKVQRYRHVSQFMAVWTIKRNISFRVYGCVDVFFPNISPISLTIDIRQFMGEFMSCSIATYNASKSSDNFFYSNRFNRGPVMECSTNTTNL